MFLICVDTYSSVNLRLKTVGVQVGNTIRIELPELVRLAEHATLPIDFHQEPALGIVKNIWSVRGRIFLLVHRLKFTHVSTDATLGCPLLEKTPDTDAMIVPIRAVSGFALVPHRCIWTDGHPQRCQLVLTPVGKDGLRKHRVEHNPENRVHIWNRFRK